MDARRPDTDDLLPLFLDELPLLDTRAPCEFARGAFPNAVNLPLMNDSERAEVGTCYKQRGQEAAIRLGHQLVAGDLRERRVAAWVTFAEQHPDGYLYCFRGGLRSEICQQWMGEAGAPYPRITGGYKAMRRFLLDALERISSNRSLIVLGGQTGCGKTELLPTLPGSIDLEALAHHRGSAFGKRAMAQPTQINFDNALAIALLRHEHRHPPPQPIIVEDESHLIGCCALPQSLQGSMQQAPVVVVELDLEARVEHTFSNYILHKLTEWRQQGGDEDGFLQFAQDLRRSLDNIRKRLGAERHRHLRQLLDQALAQHERGDSSLHRAWIRPLLRDYYDPMYNYQLQQKADRIIFRGRASEVRDYLLQKTVPKPV